MAGLQTDRYTIRPLSAQTWEAFAALCERNNGAGMGGCWCCWFHEATVSERETEIRACGGNEQYKHQRVLDGRAHAALVFDGDEAVGWCEYGPPDELPGVYHAKELAESGDPLPDYRFTCLFVDRRHRKQGVATAAVRGALDLVAQAGGGVVESYPRDTPGQKVSASFLYNGVRSTFERAGFVYVRPKGTKNCVMRLTVAAA
ncbi:GNAT family N-acetyltransferase [Luteimicrobium xylanilyticum]|uniref:N-acetyltransferase domain-containing protein n=1 Tax=Luteimicrobium xylanilyticum TaxID=1133546 RepID=A0A5P9Q7L5_9MICO|nr:GNAT family N-acetyltransferase [Luteimicrobium xylanilyticum]QFU97427.1 hypothetical protein KDY119_00925 [Luteimicrobium xylanilyticum]